MSESNAERGGGKKRSVEGRVKREGEVQGKRRGGAGEKKRGGEDVERGKKGERVGEGML